MNQVPFPTLSPAERLRIVVSGPQHLKPESNATGTGSGDGVGVIGFVVGWNRNVF
jgi:hypothetical protein